MKRFFSFFAAILFAGVWMVQAATYTVAGSSETAFGTAWTPSIEANDMTLTEGLYQWEKTDLTLPAGTIEFKVCEDHAWTNCWPSQNYQLAIPEAGIYTITITFNADSKEVNAVATKTGSAVVVPSIAMHGNFLGSWADTENFTVVEGNETAVLTLNLVAGSYEFGMRIGGSGNWTSNGAAFTRENPSAVVVAGQGNLTLAADAKGTYTFTWTFASNTLAVTFPEKGDDPIVPPTPGIVYYLKNNWNEGEWAWKAMTQDGETYKLENVVFGGSGVNYNTAESDEGSEWVPADDIKGDKIAAKDTVTFVLDPAAKTVTATLVGKYQEGGDPEPPTPGEHTYTVAGSSADAFGTAWTPSIEANDMTLTEGLYQWKKTDLTLPAGTIEFKVCEDHAWTNCWPSQNYQLAIPEAGIYTITITFNAGTKEVNAVATKTGSAVVVPSIAMHGNFTGSWVDTEKFTVAEGNATASLTLNLAAGNYEFGVRINGTWTSNGVAFARANPSAVVVAGQGNLTLAADKEGTYTFTWTYETNTLTITFPTTTALDNTAAQEKATKILRNGQIFIIKGDKMYNVMGAVIR